MNKLPLLTLTALFLASGTAVADDDWGGHHHHHHHHHGWGHRHYVPSYSYYYEPAPVYYPAPRYYPAPSYYYVPQYSSPGYNAYFQSPDSGVRFGFSGTWSDR